MKTTDNLYDDYDKNQIVDNLSHLWFLSNALVDYISTKNVIDSFNE